jgi:hypothetical protein
VEAKLEKDKKMIILRNNSAYEKRLNSPEKGKRLEEWIVLKYGSVDNFARSIHQPRQTIDAFIRGARNIGALWRGRFEREGVDWGWLTTGMRTPNVTLVGEPKISYNFNRTKHIAALKKIAADLNEQIKELEAEE